MDKIIRNSIKVSLAHKKRNNGINTVLFTDIRTLNNYGDSYNNVEEIILPPNSQVYIDGVSHLKEGVSYVKHNRLVDSDCDGLVEDIEIEITVKFKI